MIAVLIESFRANAVATGVVIGIILLTMLLATLWRGALSEAGTIGRMAASLCSLIAASGWWVAFSHDATCGRLSECVEIHLPAVVPVLIPVLIVVLLQPWLPVTRSLPVALADACVLGASMLVLGCFGRAFFLIDHVPHHESLRHFVVLDRVQAVAQLLILTCFVLYGTVLSRAFLHGKERHDDDWGTIEPAENGRTRGSPR